VARAKFCIRVAWATKCAVVLADVQDVKPRRERPEHASQTRYNNTHNCWHAIWEVRAQSPLTASTRRACCALAAANTNSKFKKKEKEDEIGFTRTTQSTYRNGSERRLLPAALRCRRRMNDARDIRIDKRAMFEKGTSLKVLFLSASDRGADQEVHITAEALIIYSE
jgi:hypothetical protein